MRGIIRVGDTTACGAKVITGDNTNKSYGKAVAHVGSKVTGCQKFKGSVQTIVTGIPTVFTLGKLIAYQNDVVSCGCPLISSCPQDVYDDGNGAQGLCASPLQSCEVNNNSNSEGGFAALDAWASESEEPEIHSYDQHIQIINKATRTPIADREYLLTVNGKTYEGQSNSDGKSIVITAQEPYPVTVEVKPQTNIEIAALANQSKVALQGENLKSITAQTTLKPYQTSTGLQVKVPSFQLTDIPAVMAKQGWEQAARLMQRWFDTDDWQMTGEVKSGKTKPETLPKTRILEDLPFEWLLTSNTKIKPIVEALQKQFAYVRQYNGHVGLEKSITTNLSGGLFVLLQKLDALGLVDKDNLQLFNGGNDFGSEGAKKLDKLSQFNFLPIGTTLREKATDDLNDLYGALGAFALKMAATQFTVSRDKQFSTVIIDEIGLYVRDTYDFNNTKKEGDQPLGYWSERGLLMPSVVNYFSDPAFIDHNGARYFKVSNDSFLRYRTKWGMGGDFLVFSTVKKIKCDITLKLSKADIQEYYLRLAAQ